MVICKPQRWYPSAEQRIAFARRAKRVREMQPTDAERQLMALIRRHRPTTQGEKTNG